VKCAFGTICGTLNFTAPKEQLHYATMHNFTAACRNFTIEIFVSMWYNIGESEVHIMSESKLRSQSMDFSVQIINLVKALKEKRESIISNQIRRSGTSIGANIHEAQYAQGTKDFISKFEIALKEASETGYWLELLYRTKYIDEQTFKALSSKCTSLRVMLIASCKTAKENSNDGKK
jgi:four helix bundle protein